MRKPQAESEWQRFRQRGTSREVLARPLGERHWQIKRGIIRRKIEADAFEKKYERA